MINAECAVGAMGRAQILRGRSSFLRCAAAQRAKSMLNKGTEAKEKQNGRVQILHAKHSKLLNLMVYLPNLLVRAKIELMHDG
jgi:hypothetical protein